MKARSQGTLDLLADRWAVVMNQVNRQLGPYPNQLYIEVATLISQTEHVIEPDPFEQDVLQTARKLAADGNLKMALFRLHEVVEGPGSRTEILNGEKSRP